MTRAYSELMRIDSFLDRYRYLQLNGQVGRSTFGFDRYLNQQFYTSREWRLVRNHVIVRDDGCDLAHPDQPIKGRVYIHHMNPLTVEDLVHHDESILDPEFLISVTHGTHNAIHYGDESLLPKPYVPRMAGDTNLW